MLDRQYYMYSTDTSHFYSSREQYLHNMNVRYRSEYKDVQQKLREIKEKLKQSGYSVDDIKLLTCGKTNEINIPEHSHENIAQYLRWHKIGKHKREKEKDAKEKLLTLLSNKVRANELSNGKNHIRSIDEDRLNITNIISVFDSALSRTIGITQDELTNDLIVVQIYHFDVFKDILFHGFTFQGEKYRDRKSVV